VKIVRTQRYQRDLKRIGATQTDIDRLELMVASNPTIGDVIPGLGGIRKVRFRLGNKGKRGGGRAIYFLIVTDELAVMLFAYEKASQTDLTEDQRRAALALLQELKR